MIRALFRLTLYSIVALSLFFGYQLYRNGEFPWLREQVENAATRGAVQAALSVNRELTDRPIDVRVIEERVILQGRVASEDEREKAHAITRAVPGVAEIDNQLELDPTLGDVSEVRSRTLGQRIDDATLNAKILAAARLDRELAEIDFEIEVRNGDVRVVGRARTVDQMERLKARIQDVDGVASVSTRMTVAEIPGSVSGAAAGVQAALGEHEHLGKFGLNVQAGSSRLILGGRVDTPAEKELAGLVAKNAANGPSIQNEIETGPP